MNTRPDMLSLLLLGADEDLVILEKRALRNIEGARFSFMSSGVEAARFLAGTPSQSLPDVIICASKLSDMDADSFCALLRLHPLLKTLSTLVVLSNDSEVEHCKTLGFNSSALLGRPYSADDIKNIIFSLAAARSQIESSGNANLQEFEKALAENAPPRQVKGAADYYRVGRQALREGRWNDAIKDFQAAARDAAFKGKAELGLAAAWKNKGDMARCNHALSNAADEFIRTKQWKNARAVYARLQRENSSAKNPFLSRAQKALRQEKHADAAKYLVECLELTPVAHICHKIAQICLVAQNPEGMLHNLESALTSLLPEQGGQLAASIHEEFKKLHHLRETRRRDAEMERRHRVSLLLERERGTNSVSEEGSEMGQNERMPQNIAESGANWRTVTKPLSSADTIEKSDADFAGGSDLISVIKYTWKLARGQL